MKNQNKHFIFVDADGDFIITKDKHIYFIYLD
jgi:hypothetical protein